MSCHKKKGTFRFDNASTSTFDRKKKITCKRRAESAYKGPYFEWCELPVELFVRIASHLPAKDVDTLRATCRLHKDRVASHRLLLPRLSFHTLAIRTKRDEVTIHVTRKPQSIIGRNLWESDLDKVVITCKQPSDWLSLLHRCQFQRIMLSNGSSALLSALCGAVQTRWLTPSELVLCGKESFDSADWRSLIAAIRPKTLALRANASLRSLVEDTVAVPPEFLLIGPATTIRSQTVDVDIDIDNALFTALPCREIHYRGGGSVDASAIVTMAKEWFSGERSLKRVSVRVPFVYWTDMRAMFKWPAELIEENARDVDMSDSDDEEMDYPSVILKRDDGEKLKVEWTCEQFETEGDLNLVDEVQEGQWARVMLEHVQPVVARAPVAGRTLEEYCATKTLDDDALNSSFDCSDEDIISDDDSESDSDQSYDGGKEKKKNESSDDDDEVTAAKKARYVEFLRRCFE